MQVDEIVARALCRSKQKWGDTAAVTEQYVDVCWRDYLPDAKVAITAYESARSAEPVAWMRRCAFDKIDVMAMPKAERPRGWAMRDVTTDKLFNDDVPLYAHPTPEASDV